MVMAFLMCARRTKLVILASLFALHAHAQAPTADSEFKRGKDLMAAGKIDLACEAFDRSQQLEANVSTMLNQANCREKNNQLATARRIFTTVAIQTDRSSDVKTVQLHNVALDRAAKLGPRVSVVTLDISVSARLPGLMLKRDGNTIDPTTWAAPIELDGGTYTFEASAPDHQSASVTVTVAAEKDKKSVTIPTLVPVEKPIDTTKPPVDTTKPPPVDTTKPPVDMTKPPPVDTTKPPPVDTTPAPRSKTLAFVVGGAGVALVATGIVFHLLAGSDYDKAVVEGNDDLQRDYWEKANTKRYFAIGTGVAGVAAIGVGVWLLLRKDPAEERVSVRPTVSSDGATVLVGGRF